jgi:hypothetical protein
MVKITYEKETDILSMKLTDSKIVDSDEVSGTHNLMTPLALVQPRARKTAPSLTAVSRE